MFQAAITATKLTPKLAECNAASFVNCLVRLSQYGLRLDGREAHLVPFKGEATLIIDYKGYVKMAYQSGKVTNIEAGVVYEGDLFDYASCNHVPWAWISEDKRPADPGKRIGAFVIVEMTNGGVHRERLTDVEINGIRARAPGSSKGPWVTDPDEMAKKTAFRRATKWIPISDELSEAMASDDDRFEPIQAMDRVVARPRGLAGLESRLQAQEPEPTAEELPHGQLDRPLDFKPDGVPTQAEQAEIVADENPDDVDRDFHPDES